MQTKQGIAMQVRCIYCLKEQYSPAVYDISNGEHACVWCGKIPPKLTEQQYRDIIGIHKNSSDLSAIEQKIIELIENRHKEIEGFVRASEEDELRYNNHEIGLSETIPFVKQAFKEAKEGK